MRAGKCRGYVAPEFSIQERLSLFAGDIVSFMIPFGLEREARIIMRIVSREISPYNTFSNWKQLRKLRGRNRGAISHRANLSQINAYTQYMIYDRGLISLRA